MSKITDNLLERILRGVKPVIFLDHHPGMDSARVRQLSRRPIVQAVHFKVIGKFIVTKLDAKEFDCMANILGVICDNLILVAANPIVGKRERLLEYLVNLRPPASMISEMLVAGLL
ncbi:MAG: hypothetical protein WCC90_18975 [Methylocella sp.]